MGTFHCQLWLRPCLCWSCFRSRQKTETAPLGGPKSIVLLSSVTHFLGYQFRSRYFNGTSVLDLWRWTIDRRSPHLTSDTRINLPIGLSELMRFLQSTNSSTADFPPTQTTKTVLLISTNHPNYGWNTIFETPNQERVSGYVISQFPPPSFFWMMLQPRVDAPAWGFSQDMNSKTGEGQLLYTVIKSSPTIQYGIHGNHQ